ncbi:hypothetical protein DUI87_22999 [Hirundo rustica rustica]|uniref:Uncharacterized protein n=1 Tax=Hirundo rustica rustica TaxID=333673 RepID=A0A3M0JJ89_HIRRU|nr:hypothetical protein DUI87_22999 [Hirundo rustica rustica]
MHSQWEQVQVTWVVDTDTVQICGDGIRKTKRHGFDGWTVQWLRNGLGGCNQRAVYNGSMSRWRLVMSGVPHGSVLGLMIFNIFINNIDNEIIECTFSMLAGVMKLRSAVDTTKKDEFKILHVLRSWAERNLRVVKDKCRVLPPRRDNSKYQCSLGADLLESSSVEMELGVWVDDKLATS